MSISGTDIELAWKIIQKYQKLGVIYQTPIVESPILNKQLGFRLFLKCENLQASGAFKARGAFNKITNLMKTNPKLSHVIAVSSGNHAQAVAMVAQYFGIKSTIIMPDTTPQTKIVRTKAWGGEVVLFNRLTQDREAIGRELCAKYNAPMVHPFDDEFVMAGQGTIGLELWHQLQKIKCTPDIVAVPIGGGGMISGISTALNPRGIKIWGAEPEYYDDFKLALETGEKRVNDPTKPSLSDALLSPTPGTLTLPVVKKLVEKIIVQSDIQVKSAMQICASEFRQICEPGGAIALAAILHETQALQGKTAVAIISGGNVDFEIYKKCIA